MLLHVIDDSVWFDRDGEPTSSGVTADGFLDALYSFGLTRDCLSPYRIILNPPNAGLVTRLAGATLPGLVGYSRLPSVAASDGRAALLHLRNLPADDLRPLRWQSVDAPGGPTYATAVIMRELYEHDEATPVALAALREHPAWAALTFLPALDEAAACQVVAAIGDPRWFRDARSDRFSSVYRRLGIGAANLAALTTGTESPAYGYRNFRSLFNTWRPGVVGDPDDPRNFLQRVVAAAGGGVRGTLAACRRLALFIMTVWEGAVAAHPEVCFIPERFFKLPQEEECWRAHVGGLGRAAARA